MPSATATGEAAQLGLFAIEEARSAGHAGEGAACPPALLQADRDPAEHRYALLLLPLPPEGALLRIGAGFLAVRAVARGGADATAGLSEHTLLADGTGLVKVIVDLSGPPARAEGFPAAEGSVTVIAGAAPPAVVPVRVAPAC